MSLGGFGAGVCSWSLLIRWAQRARCQAETPLIALFRFPRPALTSPFHRVQVVCAGFGSAHSVLPRPPLLIFYGRHGADLWALLCSGRTGSIRRGSRSLTAHSGLKAIAT